MAPVRPAAAGEVPALSAALYERLGFVHLGMLELPDADPPVWPMRRPPVG